jgi:hypothetical protein
MPIESITPVNIPIIDGIKPLMPNLQNEQQLAMQVQEQLDDVVISEFAKDLYSISVNELPLTVPEQQQSGSVMNNIAYQQYLGISNMMESSDTVDIDDAEAIRRKLEKKRYKEVAAKYAGEHVFEEEASKTAANEVKENTQDNSNK